MNYCKKPDEVEALSFGELVLHGARECEKAGHALGPNAMPWSFTYAGHHISHENDDCYLIPTPAGTARMGRDDMLINDRSGSLAVRSTADFFATYELCGA